MSTHDEWSEPNDPCAWCCGEGVIDTGHSDSFVDSSDCHGSGEEPETDIDALYERYPDWGWPEAGAR